jgi:DNA-binding transcriptional regulator YdaS (Cro superfamily)
MTATEFAAWMEARGLDDRAAAPLLAASRPEVTRWRNGTRPVPRRVARIVELLDASSPA